MIDVCVCVGSSCHIKGSNPVVQALTKLIEKNAMQSEVNLRASFCMGECRDGVCMEIQGEKIRNVSLSNIEGIFNSKIAGRSERP